MDNSIGKNPALKLSKITDLQQELKLLLEKKENNALLIYAFYANKPLTIRHTGWGEAIVLTKNTEHTGELLTSILKLEQSKVLKRIKRVESILEILSILASEINAN